MDADLEIKMISDVDRTIAFLELLAVCAENYYELLLQIGFAETEALALLTSYQDTILKLAAERKG